MPRRPRDYIPLLLYHVVQRGNNREACFIGIEDYHRYLELWKELSQRYCVAVHAYCLMTNHVHFLVTPASGFAVSEVMKNVGSRYAQYINKKYSRTGTLWKGRHKGCLIQSERYLLTCHRYIELSPVSAGMVARPEEYKWSSYHANSWEDFSWLKPNEEYEKLGKDAAARASAYRELFRSHLDQAGLHKVRQASHYCQPSGDD